MTDEVAKSFWSEQPPHQVRGGHFRIAGDRIALDGKTHQCGPLFAAWEAPKNAKHLWPIVLVHGGGFQGTEWGDTPDGRPGWAQRVIEAGYVTIVVDYSGHGRSPFHAKTMGEMGLPLSYEGGRKIHCTPDPTGRHTKWPFDPEDAAAMGAFTAGCGPLPADLAASEDMEAERLGRLLNRIGGAIAHYAFGFRSRGWLVVDRRRGLVKAIVPVEPMGSPFAHIPDIGALVWGLMASPLRFDHRFASPDELNGARAGAHQLPALAGLLIAPVIGETSSFAPASSPIVAMLQARGRCRGAHPLDRSRRHGQRAWIDLREELGRGAAAGASRAVRRGAAHMIGFLHATARDATGRRRFVPRHVGQAQRAVCVARTTCELSRKSNRAVNAGNAFLATYGRQLA